MASEIEIVLAGTAAHELTVLTERRGPSTSTRSPDRGVIAIGDRFIALEERVAELHNTAVDCPWHRAAATPVADIVASIFAPVVDKQRALVAELKKRCVGIDAEKRDGRWSLTYRVRRGAGEAAIIAGPPGGRLSPTVAALGWVFPESLRPFYDVHDGFGPFLPSAKFETLSVSRNGARKEPHALLSILVDDAGHRNGMYWQGGTDCYVSETSPPRIYKDVVDWDRDTHDIGWEKQPLQFISAVMVAWLRMKA